MITAEQIAGYKAQIDEVFAASDFEKLFEISQKLYNETDRKYAYFLGACYFNSWGTQENIPYAQILFECAANNNDEYFYATYMTAVSYYRLGKYKYAYDWFGKAEEAGNHDGLALYADSAAGVAFNLWDEVRVKFLQSEVTQGAAMVKNYMADAIVKYMRAAEEAPETMNTSLYCGYARLMILMYNMGTTGLLDMKPVAFDSFAGIVAGGFEAMQKMLDTEAHNEVLAKCIVGAHFLEDHGAPLVAEYLRAFLAIMESTRDRSAEAFYRARWHMKRIGEMRKTDPDAQLVANIFSDIDEHYSTAEKKYGVAAMNMMRQGKMPDLRKSFIPGYVPAIASCENFMEMYRQVRGVSPQGNQPPAPQGQQQSRGGFLKNLFR